ncbi:MAG TPA: hypothetical protein VGE02_00210 [Gemmatimonadales bacterium]
MLADFRDSPFPQHALHLSSYLRTPRQRALVAAAADQVGMPFDEFLSLVVGGPALEMLVPSPVHRVSWAGGLPVRVYATDQPLATLVRERRFLEAFSPDGTVDSVAVWTSGGAPRISIRPVTLTFGPDPERRRGAAATRQRATISTPREEQVALASLTDCDPVTMDYCEGPPTVGIETGGITMSPSVTTYLCTGTTIPLTPSSDSDGDGVADYCEEQLAWAFRPLLNMSLYDDAPTRETYWVAMRNQSRWIGDRGLIKIFYALGYHKDTGDPSLGLYAHEGDSEFIVLTVHEAENARWVLDDATLSAHYGSDVNATGTYWAGDLEFRFEYRGRPLVWVAQDKHANYRSKAVCNASPQWWAPTDTCEYEYRASDVELYPWSNLGQSWAPRPAAGGCTSSHYPGLYGGRPGIECFWSNWNFFAGWSGKESSATAYHYLFTAFGFR